MTAESVKSFCWTNYQDSNVEKSDQDKLHSDCNVYVMMLGFCWLLKLVFVLLYEHIEIVS